MSPLLILRMDHHLTEVECDPNPLGLTDREQRMVQRYRLLAEIPRAQDQ